MSSLHCNLLFAVLHHSNVINLDRLCQSIGPIILVFCANRQTNMSTINFWVLFSPQLSVPGIYHGGRNTALVYWPVCSIQSPFAVHNPRWRRYYPVLLWYYSTLFSHLSFVWLFEVTMRKKVPQHSNLLSFHRPGSLRSDIRDAPIPPLSQESKK